MTIRFQMVIDKYISAIAEDEYHQYRSFDYCFQAFNTAKQMNGLTLELAIYEELAEILYLHEVDYYFLRKSEKLKHGYTKELLKL